VINFGAATSGLTGNVEVTAGTVQMNAIAIGTTVANVITGGGGLIQNSANTLTLSGGNTYTGATTVNAGTLSVNGSIASSSLTTVNPGGTLGGNGIVGNTTINGGTLSPGNSIGTLTVAGNLVLTAASTYMVEVSPTASDFTHVTGSAALGGATVAASFAPGSYVEKRYTILTADGGVSGTFSGPVNANLPTNFKSSLAHDGNNAYLDLTLDFVLPSGLNRNQQAVATTLTNFFNSTGGIPLAFGVLSPQGLTQVSGELGTGTQQATFNAMNLFMGVMTDPFMAGRGGDGASVIPMAYADDTTALGYAANGKTRSASERDAYAAIYRKAPPLAPTFGQRWSVWSAGFGGSQTTTGNSVVGSNTATSSVYGGAVGADYRVSPDTMFGFAMAGGGTQFRVDNGVGTGRSDLFQVGVDARHRIGNAYFSGALAYGWQNVTTDRIVTANGIERLRANFNANAFSGRLEGGYRIATPLAGITPYAAGQFISYDLPAYAEQGGAGGNLFALNYASKSVTASRSELGLRTDRSFALTDAIFTLRGRAAWAHNFGTNRSISATFQSLPGASFVVNGAAQPANVALVTAAAEMSWVNGFSVAGTFEGEFANTVESYAGKGVLRYSW
jgi:autotransporter-associated beta strand protein